MVGLDCSNSKELRLTIVLAGGWYGARLGD